MERLEIYKRKVEGELLLKEKELEIRTSEKKESNKKSITLSPGQVTIIVAVIGLLGTYLGSFLQGMNNQKLERLKFESEIILKVLGADDIEQNKRNLNFLLDAGFIKDNEAELRKLLKDTSFNVRITSNEDRITKNTIVGFVSDIEGNLIDNVEIQVYIGNKRIKVISDSFGKFEIPYIPIQYIKPKMKLRFYKEGYQVQEYTAYIEFGTTIMVRLEKL